MAVRTGEHVPSLTRCVGEKLYVDLVSISEMRGNLYLLSRYCHRYPILNKEAHTMATVLINKHFNVYGLPELYILITVMNV